MSKQRSKTADSAAYTYNTLKTPIRFIFHTSKPHKWWALIAIVTAGSAQVAGVFEIWAVSKLVDDFASAGGSSVQIDVLLYWGLVFLAILALSQILWRVSGFSGIKWVVETNATAYKQMYEYVVGHSHSYFVDRFAGSLSNKISNAVDGSTRLIERTLWGSWPEALSLLAIFILFTQIHWIIALVAVAVVCGLIMFNIWFVKKRRPHVVLYSAASSKLRGDGVDLLTNIAAARQYVRKDPELMRLDETIYDRVRKDFKQWFMGEWLMVSNSFIAFLLIGMVISMIYVLLQNNLATAGNLVLVLMLLARMSHIFNMVGNMMNGFVRMYGEVEEGLEAIFLPYEVVDIPHAEKLVLKGGKIVWKDVYFRFGENGVFEHFNLTIQPGERVGLVGPSGAGKTTFVSLLLRQHDLDGGVICIDGQNIAEVTQDSVREQIAVVPQEPLLFHRSIRENIAYGKMDARDEEVIAVAKKAEAHDFVSELSDGYETLVGERGVKLSGGQKQRVAIARAMLKESPILILDEATSSLDSESEVAIQKALRELMGGKTVIAIAHRLSTLREMDRIIVLEKGKVVEDGTHKELVQANGTYARLWGHQAGGFLQDQ